MQSSALTLVMPETSKTAFRATSSIISAALEDIADLPIIPREIEEILTIRAEGIVGWRQTSSERGNKVERDGSPFTYSTHGLWKICSTAAPWTNEERRRRR
ncbi:hypothetical protein Rleg4DRAFT_6072 [Rhizobium leguminosarum bv. trifolii WSM2297]|uniref:Uncharacterized protein n=1 Tax=Rhizobium leguminosarum bv. trifolii WSM2297 TaxID=754762 RepID=J0CKL5_RHILT|nr:hypothetical protein Rleg4DRAFT_6072 [Rhizobium leguminosarum bv. trifolii WSM2297]